jgi:hypothetical protein
MLLSLAPQVVVNADTRSVGVEVTFVERIEVARPAPAVATASGGLPTSALIVRAIPGRAVSLQVASVANEASGSFLCSYGQTRNAQCGHRGVAAITVADGELRIEASQAIETSGLQVTISYL